MKRHKTKKELILIAVCLLILSLATACSARKTIKESIVVDKEVFSKSNEKEKSDSISNFKKDVKTVVSEDESTITETITITPIDPSREATVKDTTGIKVSVNNAVYKLERMIKKNAKELKQSIKEQQVAIKRKVSNVSFEKNAKEKVDHQTKLSEKKQFNYSYLLFLIIPLGFGAYMFYKNNPTNRFLNLFKK